LLIEITKDTYSNYTYPLSYTTLFRSAARSHMRRRQGVQPVDLRVVHPAPLLLHLPDTPGRKAKAVAPILLVIADRFEPSIGEARSEEHTSELQSRENIVCRLLPEKKN